MQKNQASKNAVEPEATMTEVHTPRIDALEHGREITGDEAMNTRRAAMQFEDEAVMETERLPRTNEAHDNQYAWA